MIKRSYLQWVGTSHFATIADFKAEVAEHGVFKRLPNLGMARQLAQPGTVVYLVHDQGLIRDCPACARDEVCPSCHGGGEQCRRCKGLGVIEVGTGGYAEVDGDRWDYVRWLRLRKTPAHTFWEREHQVGAVKPCEACGGRGRIPIGAVFAFYVPSQVVVVANGAKPGQAQQLAEQEGFVYWGPGCNPKRDRASAKAPQPGLYALARYDGPPTPLARDVEALAGTGVEVHGRVGLLAEPLVYRAKQFRGMKRWAPPALVEES